MQEPLNLKKESNSNVNENKDIYLIAGATGGSGVKIVHHLLKNKQKVRLLVRSLDKAKTTFFDVWEKLEGAYECDLANESNYVENLKEAFMEKKNCKVAYVISCLAATTPDDEKIMHVANYKINLNLIKFCAKSDIKKFIFISSVHITKPYSFMAGFINRMRPDALGLKNLVEIYLRKSGLNYIIIRPGKLEDTEKIHEIQTEQGDNLTGFISRATLAKIVFDSIEADVNKCTFEVAGNFSQMKKTYNNPFQGEKAIKLKQDENSDNIVYNHLGCLNLRNKFNLPLALIATGISLKLISFLMSKMTRVRKFR